MEEFNEFRKMNQIEHLIILGTLFLMLLIGIIK